MIPLRTDARVRGTPWMNYALIVVNLVVFIVGLTGNAAVADVERMMALDAGYPAWFQFFTYQFVHGDSWHLIANLWFLWVFGNAVNSKIGSWPYLMFYLAAGAFSGWGFALGSENMLIGASGAIAAVTTAFIVFFPRSRILFLFLFILITTFELPALWVVLLKTILWDNVIQPALHGSGNVAISAHLYGYAYGLFVSLGLLLFNLVSRDQFDLLAVVKRWNQRREFARAMRDPAAQARAQYGSVARPITVEPAQRREVQARLNRAGELRMHLVASLNDPAARSAAVDLYEQLCVIEPDHVLPRGQQLTLARLLYDLGKTPQAVTAFERFIQHYPRSEDADEIRLLIGIIYARDLEQPDLAAQHLQAVLPRLNEGTRREQCQAWIDRVVPADGTAAPGTP